MKRVTRGFLAFVTAFLIVFSTFGNAFFVAQAAEPTAIDETVMSVDSATVDSSTDTTVTGGDSNGASTTKEDGDDVDDVSEDDKTTKDSSDTKDVSVDESASDSKDNADKSVDLVVKAVEEDGYVTLSCDVDGSTIYFATNGDGRTGYEEYKGKIELDTSVDTVIWAYASYDDDTMDAVDGEKVKFEFKAESKAATRAADTKAASTGAVGSKVTELNGGEQVIIVVGDRALTATKDGSKLASAAVTTSDDGLVTCADALVVTVEKYGDYVAFKTADKQYLATPGAATQGLGFAESVSDSDTDLAKWVLEPVSSGSFNVKSNTILTSNNKNQYLSCKNNMYSVLTNNNSNKSYCVVDFYFAGTTGGGSTTEEILPGTKIENITELKDDQEFVLVFDNKAALSSTASTPDKNGNTKLQGVNVKLNDDEQLVYTDEDAAPVHLKAVKADEGDQYYITADFTEGDVTTTKYLTTIKTGNALTFEAQQNEYSLWFFEVAEDGTFQIKSVNGEYTRGDDKFPEYLEYHNDLFTVYSLAANADKTAYTFSAYTVPEFEEAPVEEKFGEKVTDLTRLYEGTEFSLSYKDEKILTDKASGAKLAAADAKFNEESKLIYSEEFATLKLEKSDVEDQYYIMSGDKYLTCPATGNGLSFVDAKDDYSLWTIDDQGEGSFYIKNAKAEFKGNPQYAEFYSGFTTYSFKEASKDVYTFSAYTFAGDEPKPVNTLGKLLTREFYDGDKIVVYYPAEKKLMTAELTNNKFGAVAAEPADGATLETKDLNALVLTVAVDNNQQYTLQTEDGKFLTATVEKTDKKTYCGLTLSDTATDNSVWYLKAADDTKTGNFVLMNANAKNGTYDLALEYYSGFTTYGIGKVDKAFIFNFFMLEEGKEPVKPVSYDDTTELTIARWGGNSNYEEAGIGKASVNGDLYTTNDMLDDTAKFTSVINGSVSQPWTFGVSNGGSSKTYYLGATGLVDDADYMQLELSSYGYRPSQMAFRLRASNKGPGALLMQYSTDGVEFNTLKKGTYEYKYTAYKTNKDSEGNETQESWEVAGDGEITDGIAKPSLAATKYVKFTFDIPQDAANADKLYIRFVPTGSECADKTKAPQESGTLRIDSLKITGYPIVDDSITGFVKANPAGGEITVGDVVELTTATEGADIYYKFMDGDFVKYDAESKVTINELPTAITAYATKEGLKDSIKVIYQFTQAQVAPVKATPNGGAVFESQKVTLKTKTEDATILYRYRTAEEIAADEAAAQNPEANTPAEDEPATEEPQEEDQFNDWIEYTGPFTLTELPCQIQVKATKDGYVDSVVSTLKYTKKLNDKYNTYFGQIHAHTNISDGQGSLAEALSHAKKVDNLDFIIITDHSNTIDNEANSKITENVDTSANDEWTYAHNLCKEYTTEDFTCAYGYEMTWSNGLGHMNTYNTPGFQSRTQKAYGTYETALQNYYASLRTVPDSISQFNHPGTTFGDFSDFAYYSEENDALITMIEVGNGEGTIGSSGYFPSYEYYTRALDKGWHVAPTNNQDNHKGKWGDANTARTVMLADTNDEDAIYDAMRNYRIYATEDNDLSIYYTLDGNIMGTILDKDAVGDELEIKAEISDPTDGVVGRVEVIVNGGKSIASQDLNTGSGTLTFNVPSDYSYYYLRITEDDRDIAVTAPVWVGEVEACGINKTYTNTVLPVAGEDLDVNVEFYNNETTPLEVKSIEIVVSDVDGNKTPVVNEVYEEGKYLAIPANDTSTYKTNFTYSQPGNVTYEVRVEAVLNGIDKVYTDKLAVNYVLPSMVSDIVIDGTHYNDYVAGYYGGNMNAFVSLCAKQSIRATVVRDEITPEMLADCKLLVISAPAKKNGTANAGDYVVSHYDDAFLTMVKEYVQAGGSVAVCGLADYQDSTNGQTATEQNKLLEAIGSTIRMGSDEVCDDTHNGGQVYRMYPTTFNLESDLFNGLKDGQVYSQYSGCSVDISNAVANDVVDDAQWLVKGFDTTYSVDCKDASGNGYGDDHTLPNGVKGLKNDNDGNVTFLACQKTKAGGTIYVAGGVFVSDFEVKAEIDNADSLPYANYTICNNILGGATVELPVTTIAEARKGQMNEVFAVEGYVTAGTDNEFNKFFDTIYIQDETGGMDIFPYAETGLAIGTKVRIVGFLAQYQGDLELKIISSKVLDAEPNVYAPKEVDTKTAMDYETLGGSLLKTTGKVTRVAYASDGEEIEEFWLADDTGVEAAIFIDGYISSGSEGVAGKAKLGEFVKVGNTVSAAGVLYMHPEGDSTESVPVFRVRNTDEITLVAAAEEKTGTWKQGWGSTSYVYDDGTVPVGKTVVDGNTYYFDENGKMSKNAQVEIDGNKYLFGSDGKMVTDWHSSWGKKYYYDENGVMQTGKTVIDGDTYYFDENGKMVKNEKVVLDGNTYLFGSDGKMVTGWYSSWGKKYYYFEDGAMATGDVEIDGVSYHFDENGKLIK